jgi:hypothetical protein
MEKKVPVAELTFAGSPWERVGAMVASRPGLSPVQAVVKSRSNRSEKERHFVFIRLRVIPCHGRQRAVAPVFRKAVGKNPTAFILAVYPKPDENSSLRIYGSGQ